MAKVYCSGENNCWKIPEADENKTVQALSVSTDWLTRYVACYV